MAQLFVSGMAHFFIDIYTLNFKEDVMSNSRKTVVESKTVHSPVPAVAKHSKKEAETASPGLQ